jgi:hypothetical protein
LPDTAIDDCVRAVARTVPLRSPAQLRQLQFHCGKPPPAAEPNTTIFMTVSGKPAALPRAWAASAIRDVHRDFEAETPVDEFRFGPGHGCLLDRWMGYECAARSQGGIRNIHATWRGALFAGQACVKDEQLYCTTIHL